MRGGGMGGGSMGRGSFGGGAVRMGGARGMAPGAGVRVAGPRGFGAFGGRVGSVGFNGRPRVRTMSPSFGRFNHFGLFGFNTFNGFNDFDHDDFFRAGFFFGRHPRFSRFPFFGTGFSPFVNNWGWGWGAWPYAVDYSAWNYDQAQNQYDQSAQYAQLQGEIQDSDRRQMELEQELADQRAADAASRASQSRAAAPASTPTDRELPPTVLVYRDHHEVEVRNYAIAGNTIYDFGPHWTRKISIADLDIPATVAANEERGIEFRLPDSPVKVKQQ